MRARVRRYNIISYNVCARLMPRGDHTHVQILKYIYILYVLNTRLWLVNSEDDGKSPRGPRVTFRIFIGRRVNGKQVSIYYIWWKTEGILRLLGRGNRVVHFWAVISNMVTAWYIVAVVMIIPRPDNLASNSASNQYLDDATTVTIKDRFQATTRLILYFGTHYNFKYYILEQIMSYYYVIYLSSRAPGYLCNYSHNIHNTPRIFLPNNRCVWGKHCT